MAFQDYVAEEIATDAAAGLIPRREALRRLGLLGLSLTAATALLAACGDDDADTATGTGTGDDTAATTTSTAPAAEAGPTTTSTGQPAGAPGETITYDGPAGKLTASWAAAAVPVGGLLVIHENKGLTPHFQNFPSRFAEKGYNTLAVDLLSGAGGTSSFTDPAQATAALTARGAPELVADLKASLDELERRTPGQKLAAMGFCFGGGMTWALLAAKEARVAAAMPFYGPLPEGADFTGDKAAVLAVYAELDTRVNASRDAARAALEAAGLTHEVKTYPGADHAFFNETGQRYNAGAAATALTDVLAWLTAHVAS